jgi:hypothetical protein
MKKETKQILARVLELTKELEIRKALYDEVNMLTMQLQADGFENAELNGFTLELVDNFSKSNVSWRVAAVQHYEIKIKAVK